MIRKYLVTLLVVLLSFHMAASAMAAPKQVERAQEQFAEEVAKLHPYLQIDSDGFFQLSARSAKEAGVSLETFSLVQMQFAEINRELGELGKEERLQMFQIKGEAADGGTHTESCSWVYVLRWALQAFAWFVIIAGGVNATLGLFADATILGLPAGAVLGALGIWLGITGSALLWYADNYYTPTTVFVCW